MQAALFTSLLLLTATLAAGTRKQPPGEHEMYYPDREAEKTCEEICVEDKGMDKKTCDTECATSTDLATHHMDGAAEDFAADEAYNEKGGKAMEKKVEETTGEEVLDCAPQVDIEHAPDLKELDTKQDGVIDKEEARDWGRKCCVPDEMTDQIFDQADADVNGEITEEEYESSGPDTAQEDAVDEALEEHYEGDDEYNNVQAPKLEEFDENKDGSLDPAEHKDAVKFEMERREEGRWSVGDDEVPEEEAKEAFDEVDKNGDGKIEGDEYEEPAEDGGSDMGEEMADAAEADEDAEDPDDLNQQPDEEAPAASMLSKRFQVTKRKEAAPPTASMLSTRFKVAARNEAAFLRRFNIPEQNHVSKKRTHRNFGHFGHALVELARKHQALHQKKLRSHHQRTSFRRHRASKRM